MDERDLNAIKGAAAPVAQPVPQRRLPEQLRSQLADLERDTIAVNTPVAEQRIDLGPLPDSVRAQVAGATDTDSAGKQPWTMLLKKSTEAACAPMDFGELIMTGRVQQDVPVLPGKMRITFQSLTGTESYWIERAAIDQPAELRQSWVTYMQLAMCVQAVNGTQREPFYVDNKIDRGVLERRLAMLLKMNTRMIELLIVNMYWFFDRVSSLYENDFAAIKNG